MHFCAGLRPEGHPDAARCCISAAAAAHRRRRHSPEHHAGRPGDADGAAQPHLPQPHKGMVLHHIIRWSSFVPAAAAAFMAQALPRTACCLLLMSPAANSAAQTALGDEQCIGLRWSIQTDETYMCHCAVGQPWLLHHADRTRKSVVPGRALAPAPVLQPLAAAGTC
jgi:hypothetical protein